MGAAKTARMKKFIAFVSIAALQGSSAFAWVGGPWSGGTHDNHTTGLFGGSITMPNGSGIFRFSSTETAQMGTFNTSMIYYKGVTFLGSCQANIDFDAKTVDGITNGSAYNRSPAPTQQRTSPINDNNPNWSPTTPGNTTPAVTVPLTPTIEAGAATPRTFTVPGGGVSGPIGIANTSWQGKITKMAPNVRFKAKGEAAFRGAEPTILRFTITEGPPFVDNRPPTPPDPVNLTPGILQEVTVDRGGNDPFPNPRNRVKIRVMGSRLSYNVNVSTGGLNGGLDGTGGGGFAF
jgi:hypothetical protein